MKKYYLNGSYPNHAKKCIALQWYECHMKEKAQSKWRWGEYGSDGCIFEDNYEVLSYDIR